MEYLFLIDWYTKDVPFLSKRSTLRVRGWTLAAEPPRIFFCCCVCELRHCTVVSTKWQIASITLEANSIYIIPYVFLCYSICLALPLGYRRIQHYFKQCWYKRYTTLFKLIDLYYRRYSCRISKITSSSWLSSFLFSYNLKGKVWVKSSSSL